MSQLVRCVDQDSCDMPLPINPNYAEVYGLYKAEAESTLFSHGYDRPFLENRGVWNHIFLTEMHMLDQTLTIGIGVTMRQSKTISFVEMDWFVEHRRELERRYKGQWIAILNCKVVASADSARELRNYIKGMKLQSPFIVKVDHDSWNPVK